VVNRPVSLMRMALHLRLQYLQSQQVALGRPSLIFSTGSPLPRKCVDGNHIDIASGEWRQGVWALLIGGQGRMVQPCSASEEQ
jgi:hypothetical protein